MIIFMWGLIFIFAGLPGVAIGWLVGKLPMPSLLCVAVLTGGSAYAGFTVSKKMNPSPNLSDHYHYESLVMYLPPILLAMLLGLWLSRAFSARP
jgi:hypothetical protein